MDMSNVLESWAFLEMITPGELPSLGNDIDLRLVKNQKRFRSVVPYSQSRPLLTELELKNPGQHTKQFTYYMNTYTKNDLITLLRAYFKSEEEIINKLSDRYYSFTFHVNDAGEYIADSLFIPHVQLIVDDIERVGHISYADFTNRYEEKKKNFEEELQVIFQNGVDEKALQKAEQCFDQYFKSPMNEIGRPYVQCRVFKKTTKIDDLQFNSFFLEDLQMIMKKGMNPTLQKFIEGTAMEIDIDENQQAIEEILSIHKLPLGRWPSPVNHRLSLMQQVSVNHILNGDETINSVNGPPGTGKTTLLKDIFAQLMVERALEMVSYKNPTDAFHKVGKQKIDFGAKAYDYNMFELDASIAKYSMVVASCNNGAVENISKELPLLKEIARNERPSEKKRKEEMEKTGIDPIRFYDYDQAYAEEVEKLEYFTTYAEKLLDDDEAWGMFSAAFGKSSNIQKVSQSLQNNQGENIPILNYLSNTSPSITWEEAVAEFNDLRDEIEIERKELQEYMASMATAESIVDQMKDLPEEIATETNRQTALQQVTKRLEQENQQLKERLDNIPKPSFFGKMIQNMMGKTSKEETEIRQQRDAVLKDLTTSMKEKNQCEDQIEAAKKQLKTYEQKLQQLEQIKEKYKHEQVILSTNEFWSSVHYEERQQAVLWQTHELNFKRGMLFLKALQVHKVFLHENHLHLKTALSMLSNLRSINVNIDENKENIGRMWKTLHLLFPVMSTTFASFSSMYRGMDANFIDYLFIDEAGQASPQQAAGALWRAKRAIIVGDPIQIEPVVTLDETILSDIRKRFSVSVHYIGTTASVQTMADYANPIGTYKGNAEEKERIGIPLWVHRRCIEPMFSIANQIAYENKMVLANEKIGQGEWFHVNGRAAQAQYVTEQGDFIMQQIEQKFKEAQAKEEEPSVFVITPFTAVKSALIQQVNRQLGKKIEGIRKWANDSIGTVHTFQGKEADIVYFVTGTDAATDSAANWSCAKPNLLNVATTRAKKEFYVVGDLERFKTKAYYDVIIDRFTYFQKEKSREYQGNE